MGANRLYYTLLPDTMEKFKKYLDGRHNLSYFTEGNVIMIDGNMPEEFVELGIFIGSLRCQKKHEHGTVRNTG